MAGFNCVTLVVNFMMLTKENIQQMDEAALRKEVLLPLLTAMGFKDVYEYHGGSGEQGKDIVCWLSDKLDTRENFIIVAKAAQMSGKAQANKGTAAEIQMQIRQCFGSTYTDPVSAEQQKVHQVWVISNKKISKEAINAITSGVANPAMMKDVRFIDGDHLWKLVEQHLPSSMWHFIKETQKRAIALDSHYEPEITISGQQTTVSLKSKFPGAAEEKPITFTTRLVDQEAAQQFHALLEHYQETGEPADIPANLIAGIDFPDFVQNIFGMTPQQQFSMRILPIPNLDWIPVRISFINDDNDNFICHLVRLKVAGSGSKKATIVNEPDNVPFSLTLIFRFEEQTSEFSLSPCLTTHNAVEVFEYLQFCRCLSKKPTMKMEDLRTGMIIAESALAGDVPEIAGEGYTELIGMLAKIQKETNKQIIVPDRNFTNDEIETIQEVYYIITKGRVEATWEGGKATYIPDLATLELFVNSFAGGKSAYMLLALEETVTLFETDVPLGRIHQKISSVKCVNHNEILERYDELRSGTASITLQMIPGEDNKVVKEYLDWPKETSLHPKSEVE